MVYLVFGNQVPLKWRSVDNMRREQGYSIVYSWYKACPLGIRFFNGVRKRGRLITI